MTNNQDEIRAIYRENGDGSRGGLMRAEGPADPTDLRQLDSLVPPPYLRGGKYRYDDQIHVQDHRGERTRVYKQAAD
ncbi:hypothetical protein KW805_02890 [Candidatus Pacearchaeota archaeon]|nr:hypothetical protein [Candidatus Pacearchaeota archaeon]